MAFPRVFFAVCLGITALLVSAGTGQAISFTGSLSTETDVDTDGDTFADAPGLQGPAGTQWAAGPTVLDWTVSQDSPGDPWHYVYELSAPAQEEKEISHFAFEVSDFLTADDFTDPDLPSEPVTTPNFDEWGVLSMSATSQGNSNPGMPGQMYGVKFDSTGDPLVYEADFWLDVGPTWGDAYGKGGAIGGGPPGPGGPVFNAIWNAGFVLGETEGAGNDPVAPPADGHLLGHLLVPDTTNGPPPPPPPVVPEPMTAGGLLLGVGALVGYLRRRRR
jgi:hypothetical protein